MKTGIVLGISSIGLNLLGQAMPDFVPGLVSQFGALGLVFWMMIHTTMVTIPGMQKRNDEAMAKLLEMHKVERAEMLVAFNKTLEQKRIDYNQEIDRQRENFDEMLQKFACKAK